MGQLIRVHAFVKLANEYGYDMWYDPAIRMWTLMNPHGDVESYFTRAVLINMGLTRFATVYLGAKNGVSKLR